MSVSIKPIDYNRLAMPGNVTPNVQPGPFEGAVTAAPFVTMVNQLFGSKGPLGQFKLVALTPGKGGERPFWTIDVQGSWRESVKELIEGTIQRAINENKHLNGWTFQVVDSSNLELPRMQRAPQS